MTTAVVTTVTPVPCDTEPVITVMDPITGFLQEMEEQIRMRGWCKGCLMDDTGRVCLMGSATQVRGASEDTYQQAIQRLSHLIARKYPQLTERGELALPMWNDNHATSAEDVYALLREARG